MKRSKKPDKLASAETPKNNLSSLIENIDNPAWSVDCNGCLTAFNKTFQKYFKKQFHIIPEIGNPLFEQTGFTEINDWKEVFLKAIKGERLSKEIRTISNNKVSYSEIVINPVTDSENKICGAVFFIYDVTDRKIVENSLFSSKEHLQALIDNIPNLVWLKDEHGKFIIVNQSFLNFFDLRFETINGDNINISDENHEFWNFIKDDSDILSSGAKLTEEKCFVSKNENRWFEIHKTPVYTSNFALSATTGMARDITGRKTIENILLESEEKFRQFAENTSDSFILCSLDSVLYVNPAFQKIFGRSLKEAYQHFHIPEEWVYPEDRQQIISFFNGEEYKSTGKFNGQYRVIKTDGSISWIWERNFPVFNNDGQIIRIISVASDITRQKQLEEDLLETKTQQQAILDNIPHLAWLKDIDGKYVSVNESFAKYYKCPKNELVGKTDSEICHPDIAELYAYNDYMVLKTKKQQQFDEFVDTPDGTIYTETIKTPIINRDGDVIGITGISRDITYYKRLEQQLRSNDDKLKSLLRNSTDAITVIDPEGKILFDSSFIIKVLGKPYVEELNNRKFIDYVTENDQTFVQIALNLVISNPEVQQKVEFSCIKNDGSIIYFESFFTNHINNKLIGGIVINSRDITERKIAENKEIEYQNNLIFLENTALEFLSIASSEQIYNYIGNKIHELVPESVVIFSSYDESDDSLIIQNITGVDKFLGIIIDFLGQNPLHYKAQLSKQMKRELHASANKLHTLNGGLFNIFSRQIDFMVCKALEKLISLNKSYGMGIARAGKLLGSVIILTRYAYDIKDSRIVETFMYQASIALLRRNLEKELITAKEKAEESDKLKSTFLANISHEIRTPVNGIIGFSQLLDDNNISEEKRKEYIEIIKANADTLIRLIDDILDVSIIQEGQVKLRKSTVNINLLLDELYSNYSAFRFREKGIQLEVVKSLPDESAVLYTDPLRVKQVLNNLISNAFKFTERGTIEFGYVTEPGFVQFYVRDTGIGIPEHKVEAIFHRFIQADTSYTRRFGGFGLGLAISKGLVELLGGKILVNSVPEEGSVFSFTIPYSDDSWKNPANLVESAKTNPSLLN
jgi:PAS domain S-box-containing protein